jgi:hypothetical protein
MDEREALSLAGGEVERAFRGLTPNFSPMPSRSIWVAASAGSPKRMEQRIVAPSVRRG